MSDPQNEQLEEASVLESDGPSSEDRHRFRLPQVIKSNLVWNIVRWGASQGATFVMNVVSARALGREAFGAFGILQTSLQTFAQVASFSTASTATKYVAEYRHSDPRRAGRIARLCGLLMSASGLVVASAVVLLARQIASRVFGAPDLHLQVALLGVGAFFTVSCLYHGGVLAGLHRFDQLAFASLIAAPLFVIGGAACAFQFGLTGAVSALVGNAVVAWGLTKWFAGRETTRLGMVSGRRESLQEASIIHRFALPGAITGLTAMPAIWIASSVLVRQPHGLGEMALFSASNSFRSIVLFVPGVLSGTALPSLNDAKGRNDATAFKTIYWSTLMLTLGVTATAAVAIALSGPILLPLYGKDFGKGAATLAILMAATVLDGMFGITMAAFQSTARMWTFLLAVVLPRDITLVVAAYLLAPSWGAAGLASAYALGASVAAAALALLTWQSGVLSGRWEPALPKRAHRE